MIWPFNPLSWKRILLRGVRFIGRFNDFEIPVTNGELYYVFQGVTRDGQYLISFMYPITTNALPDLPGSDVSCGRCTLRTEL